MILDRLCTLLQEAIQTAQAVGDLPSEVVTEISIERPRRPEHGDFATPVALSLTRLMKRSPHQIAEFIIKHLPANDLISSVEIAGPGYINIYLNPTWLAYQVDYILEHDVRYADSNLGQGRQVLIEFVSANPTGPLTVGHGRNAVIGDVLANVFAAAGWQVIREYYYNDAGRQMRVLGESLQLRVRQLLGEPVKLSDEYYQGEYLLEIAHKVLDQYGPPIIERDWQFFKDYAQQEIFTEIRATLQRLGLTFDVFTNEASFYENGAIWQVLGQLREKGYAYDKDGAVWFRATEFGFDQDRVLVRSTGEPTYRLPDIAYHLDKLKRGFDLIIDVLGADHVAEMPDVVTAVQALGHDTSKIKPLFYQFVTLVRHGELVKMSTRLANFITLDELIDEVGTDVVRFFMIMRSLDAQMELDLELAKEQSEQNPVYYIQYAHARTFGILERNAPERGVVFDPTADVTLLSHPSEINLIKEMMRLREVVKTCCELLEPHHLTKYAQDLAYAFSKFYRDCPVLTAPDAALVQARLKLVKAAQISLARTLKLMGMRAPQEM